LGFDFLVEFCHAALSVLPAASLWVILAGNPVTRLIWISKQPHLLQNKDDLTTATGHSQRGDL
jgi:hypothetical protein